MLHLLRQLRCLVLKNVKHQTINRLRLNALVNLESFVTA